MGQKGEERDGRLEGKGKGLWGKIWAVSLAKWVRGAEVLQWDKGNTYLSPTLLISSHMEAGLSQNAFLPLSMIV